MAMPGCFTLLLCLWGIAMPGRPAPQVQRAKIIPARHSLVAVASLDPTLLVDLRYATTRNFTGRRLYRNAVCLLHRRTAARLIAAQADFRRLGYRVKIWDAYRPASVQWRLWRLAPDRRYVANPRRGSPHSRGGAVDVTLVDRRGREVPMPTGFDAFSRRAGIHDRTAPPSARRHRELLARVMIRHGFRRSPGEWWHFTDRDARAYPLLDIPLSVAAVRANRPPVRR